MYAVRHKCSERRLLPPRDMCILFYLSLHAGYPGEDSLSRLLLLLGPLGPCSGGRLLPWHTQQSCLIQGPWRGCSAPWPPGAEPVENDLAQGEACIARFLWEEAGFPPAVH